MYISVWVCVYEREAEREGERIVLSILFFFLFPVFLDFYDRRKMQIITGKVQVSFEHHAVIPWNNLHFIKTTDCLKCKTILDV